jgi:transcriptional regulator with PAS, ATPase and Fis domain
VLVVPAAEAVGPGDRLIRQAREVEIPVLAQVDDHEAERAAADVEGLVEVFGPRAGPDEVALVGRRILERRRLQDVTGIVGETDAMHEVLERVVQIAPVDSTVLITGESGTGKELVARTLHARSERAKGPFIAVNCAALPKDILENELFGHEKGAFTGSVGEKAGCFELADGGTLFLDEVAEMSSDTQVKFLRAIENRSFRRLGGKKEIEVDIRVVAATNRNVHQAVEDGDLREDLYYRLAVVEVALPPLRQRGADVELLAKEFLERCSGEHGREIEGFSEEAHDFLVSYDWPGNVRELKNAVERAVIMTSKGEKVSLEAIRPAAALERTPKEVRIPVGESLKAAERRMILQTFASTGGDRGRAAAILGIDEETLEGKLRELLETEA